MAEQSDSSILYTVRKDADGNMLVELTDEGMLQRLQKAAALAPEETSVAERQDRSFFLAERTPDGRYQVTLTEEGVRKFETALGLADDFGRHRKISTQSTIADLMDRTATREELSEISRRDRNDLLHRMRKAVLSAKYKGSEEPSGEQKSAGHIFKLVVVGLAGLWTLQQFGIAIQDVRDIPGIVAQIPNDILHLNPGQAIGEVGNTVDDATSHVVLGAEGTIGTYILARIVRPFDKIYRKDQLVTGQRPFLRLANWTLRRVDRDGGA